jgi:hypothetical protein
VSLGRYRDLVASPFMENRPTGETTATLRDELLFQRATQTYLWALPWHLTRSFETLVCGLF